MRSLGSSGSVPGATLLGVQVLLALLSGGGAMATLTIRNLPEPTKLALKARAAKHDRSMEAEVREILNAAVRPQASGWASTWLEVTEALRGDDFVPPTRQQVARGVDLG